MSIDMSEKQISKLMTSFIRNGNLEKVKEMLNMYGLSRCENWSHGYVLLRDALEYKHVDIAVFLISKNCKLFASKSTSTKTPLYFAVKNNYTEIIHLLLSRRAPLSNLNELLPIVVENSNSIVVQLFISHLALVNYHEDYQGYLLHLAAEMGNKDILELLLRLKVHPNAQCSCGKTALHIAVDKGHFQLVDRLIKYGACVNSGYTSACLLPIHIASKNKNEQVIEVLLNNRADIEGRDIRGCTALHFASEEGNEKIVELLLNYHADIEAKDNQGHTALHSAAKEGNEEILNLLLNNRANIKTRNNDGETALHSATKAGNEKIVELLLKRNADIEAKDNNLQTALHIAAKEGKKEIVKILLSNHAQIDAKDSQGYTALHTIAKEGRKKTVQLLLSNAIHSNSTAFDDLPLHITILMKHAEIAVILLHYGADINAKSEHTETPLYMAARTGHFRIVEALLSFKPNVSDKYNRLALLAAVCGIEEEHTQIVKDLLQYGFIVNPEDVGNLHLQNRILFKRMLIAVEKREFTIIQLLLGYGVDINRASSHGEMLPLHLAAKFKHADIAKFLLQYKADVDCTCERHFTPLHIAIQNDSEDITKLLLEYNANVNLKKKYDLSPLHFAVKRNHAGIVKLLIDYKADVNVINNCGKTPLHFAAHKNCEKIAQMLLQSNAVVNSEDGEGLTPLHLAAKNCHTKMAKLLLKWGADVHAKCGKGMTLLHYAAKRNDCIFIKFLLEHNVEVDSVNHDGETALHIACRTQNWKSVTCLLDYYADINIENKLEFTALATMCQGGIRSQNYQRNVRVISIFCEHIFKRKVANLYVNRINLEHFEDYVKYCELAVEKHQCEEEIRHMKSKMIVNGVSSLYDILTKELNQMARYVCNENTVKILKRINYRKFLIYGTLLSAQLLKIIERKDFLEQIYLGNYYPILPVDCLIKISDYINNNC